MIGVMIPDARGGLVWIHGSDGGLIPIKIVVDAAGHLQVDVVTAALPAGGATAANQATEITALQLIDDLRNALATVAGDQLRTDVISYHPHDTLNNFSLGYNARYAECGVDLNAVVGVNTKNLATVPAGEVWQIRQAWMFNTTNTSDQQLLMVLAGSYHYLVRSMAVLASAVTTAIGDFVLAAGDMFVVSFAGCTAGDDLFWGASGVKSKIA